MRYNGCRQREGICGAGVPRRNGGSDVPLPTDYRYCWRPATTTQRPDPRRRGGPTLGGRGDHGDGRKRRAARRRRPVRRGCRSACARLRRVHGHRRGARGGAPRHRQFSASRSSVSSGEAGGPLPLACGPASQKIAAARGLPPRERSQGSEAGAEPRRPSAKRELRRPGSSASCPRRGHREPRFVCGTHCGTRSARPPEQPLSGDEVDWVRALIKGDHRLHKEKREQKRRRVLLAECGPSGVSRRGGGPR